MSGPHKKTDLPRDLVIPTKLALSEDIDDAYKFLFAYIAFRSSTRGYIWHENETLADALGKTTRSIERGIKALKDAKWIYVDNWVKKGSLYDRDYRKVIWVYTDYLKALDSGGYGAAKPLPFKTWRLRFINALGDQSAIPLVLYFFPISKFMAGTLNVNYDHEKKRLYRFIKNEDGYKIEDMNKDQADDAWQKIYSYYCGCFKQQKKEQIPARSDSHRQEIQHFDQFQDYVRTNYVDKEIAERDGNRYTVNALGMLMEFDEDSAQQLATDEAMEVWQWLYTNQEKIEPLA